MSPTNVIVKSSPPSPITAPLLIPAIQHSPGAPATYHKHRNNESKKQPRNLHAEKMMMNSATLGLVVLATALLATEPASAIGRSLAGDLEVPRVPPKADIAASKGGSPPSPVTPVSITPPTIDGARSVKTPKADEANEGDEGDEGNEGFEDLITDRDFNEGDEGDEGDEGKEGDEGDEGGDSRVPLRSTAPDEGDEGDEGNEGNEGGTTTERKNEKIQSQGRCESSASASTYSEMTSAHTQAVAAVMTELCRAGFDGELEVARDVAEDQGKAIAAVLTEAQAQCMTSGQAFGCASASASAVAWAEASAEAHSLAVASSAEDCDCLADADALSSVTGSVYVELIADAFSRAEARACSKGSQTSSATAFSQCGAAAYADLLSSVGSASGNVLYVILVYEACALTIYMS